MSEAVQSPLSVAQPVSPGPGIARLLPAGETPVLAMRPSLWFVVLPKLEFLLTLLVCGIAATLMARMGIIGLEPAAAAATSVAIASLSLTWRMAVWLTTFYLLTPRRVLAVRGVLRQSVIEARIEDVRSVGVARLTRERLLGLGSLVVGTAAAGGRVGEVVWQTLPNPGEVLAVLRSQVETARTAAAASGKAG
ncbi:MAG: PH domain-containing protein [Planctomycetaceae bacterium]|jgi:hypothetical protein|nr:PH domain-containing protein [Phycisphaerales bacterium]MCE2651956.1 PH domain-containing protein [Planctomycetaceae bacterium]